MALVKALNLEPMNISRLRSEVRVDIVDGPEQAAQHLELRTSSDGHAYSWKEFVDFFGPYSAKAWRRARVATQKEKDEALLRRVRLLLEK